MNGINLEQFQFEFDLTWMAFFQNSKGHTYTRYGGRDDRSAEGYLTQKSLLLVMNAVLELHDTDSVQRRSKYEPVPVGETTPVDIPTLKQTMAKRKDSSCIHCHDVKNSQLRHMHEVGELRKNMVFTYPSPGLLGLHLDPDQQNKVASVDSASPAARAGVRVGDIVESSDGQRILTFADLARVLELAPKEGQLELVMRRNRKSTTVSLDLPFDWKRSNDPSWRPSVGMVGPGGGFWGKPVVNEAKLAKLGISRDDLAIRVTFIWAAHAKKAGIKMNDIVVGVEGESQGMTMRQFHAWLQLNRNWGDSITLKVIRGGKRIDLEMKLPDGPSE